MCYTMQFKLIKFSIHRPDIHLMLLSQAQVQVQPIAEPPTAEQARRAEGGVVAVEGGAVAVGAASAQ